MEGATPSTLAFSGYQSKIRPHHTASHVDLFGQPIGLMMDILLFLLFSCTLFCSKFSFALTFFLRLQN